ncbi:hypothetical protein [Bdellovibrio sp.]|uniref:hypothetical protein n=1 Tax=Bdellovibrio TaxID=958 RepID=UPI003221F158
MSSFDDLKERFITDSRATWERIQESTAYNQMRDRYENMTPAMQKMTVVGGAALLTLIVLSIPYGKYTQSNEYVGEFESKRMTIRELLKVSRESSDVPQIPQAPSMDMIRNNVDNQIKAANLLPEQIQGTEIQENASNLVPKNLTEGLLQVSLVKLNLRQVLDLGYQFQSINSSVKLKDMIMTANREDSRYFDVVYKLVALAVPAPPAPEPMEPPRGRKNRNNGDE